MDREQLLKQEIDKIVALGKNKGSVSEDEIMAKLEHLNATAEDMEVVFNPVRRPSSMEKADLAQKNTQPILDAYQAGVIGKGTVLRELKQQANISGCWTNITDKMIEEADKEDEEEKAKRQQEEEELENAVKDESNGKEENE